MKPNAGKKRLKPNAGKKRLTPRYILVWIRSKQILLFEIPSFDPSLQLSPGPGARRCAFERFTIDASSKSGAIYELDGSQWPNHPCFVRWEVFYPLP